MHEVEEKCKMFDFLFATVIDSSADDA